ncbi:MAG: SsrA-binding protein SmpB [Candidatus Omnitrophica bacterium]|nr:SsrA-binding protein SmpB [Candidatus Omnitrophota bacterium]
MPDKNIASNRQARFNYTILESLEAGIALTGTEVKSIRNGNVSLNESFARIDDGEIFVHNMHVAPYEFGNINNPDAMRPRKLLLHKSQIRKLSAETSAKHLALIPLKLYFKDGLVKVELALGKGKKHYDKRESIKKREVDRDIRKRVR